MIKKYGKILVIAASITVSTAYATDVDKAISYRQSVFHAMKWHFAPMVAMIKGKKEYDAAEFERRAQLVAVLARMPQEGFANGTDEGDTEAKAEIWQNKAEFDQAMQLMVDRSAVLARAAKSADMAKIKPAFGALAKACKGCHNDFRED